MQPQHWKQAQLFDASIHPLLVTRALLYLVNLQGWQFALYSELHFVFINTLKFLSSFCYASARKPLDKDNIITFLIPCYFVLLKCIFNSSKTQSLITMYIITQFYEMDRKKEEIHLLKFLEWSRLFAFYNNVVDLQSTVKSHL